MEVGLFWVPLAGGYLFLTHCNYFRFIRERINGYRLLFDSTCAGLLLVLFAWVLLNVPGIFFPQWGAWIQKLSASELFIFDNSLFWFAFLLGPILASLWNRFYPKHKGVKRALENTGNMVELMLLRALESRSLIEATLTGGKVYIGWFILGDTQYHDRRFISLCPLFSGFRDKKHKVILTTNYRDVYQSIRKYPQESPSDRMDFEITFPMSQLQSVRPFDIGIYQKFNSTTHP